MKCRFCQSELTYQFIDLGSAPPSNAYLTAEQLQMPEKWYPLRVLFCTNCWLVQTADYRNAEELFDSSYAYFSSFSTTWLAHAEQYVTAMVNRFHLNETSFVVEVAANDGYLLQFVKKAGIPCLGIEPTASTAAAARNKGITVIEDFFGVRLARKLNTQNKKSDLIVANNVLAHVPDINDFVQGFPLLLKPDGVATFEFAYIFRLIDGDQFDTIYHEHFSYLSFYAVKHIFEENGLLVFDVEELPTQGGSLRVYVQRKDTGSNPVTQRVTELLAREINLGVNSIEYYSGFQSRADGIKNDLITFLIQAKRENKKVVAYGAAAKGTTLLNYAGIRKDLLSFVADLNPAKQGKYLPGCRIPILSEKAIRDYRPDYVLILPWNIREEISTQLSYVKRWGGCFVTAVPTLEVR